MFLRAGSIAKILIRCNWFILIIILGFQIIAILNVPPGMQSVFENESLVDDRTINQPGQQYLKIAGETVNFTLVSPADGSTIRNNVLINISVSPQPSSVVSAWDNILTYAPVIPTAYLDGYFELPVPQTDGTHHLYVKANNSDDEWFEERWSFTVDNTSIFFTLVSPVESGYYQSGTPVIIDYDPGPVGKLFSWDGGSQSSILTPLPAGDGLHQLHIEVESDTGNWYTTDFNFYTDDTPAALTLSLVNGSTVESRTPFNWTSSDDLTAIDFSWDGGDNQNDPVRIPDGSGWHELVTWTVDRANNTIRYYHRFHATLKIDLSYPVLIDSANWQVNFTGPFTGPQAEYMIDESTSILYPVDGVAYIATSTVPVLDFSDTPDDVYYNWWFNSTYPGTNVTSPSTSPATEGEWKYFQVWANDSEGNWAMLAVNVTTDDTPPSVTSSDPVNESKIIPGTVINFTCSESLKQELYSWDGNDNITSVLLPDAVGKHVLDIWLEDWAGNWQQYYYEYYTAIQVTTKTDEPAVNGTILKGGTLVNFTFTPEPADKNFSWDGDAVTSVPVPLPLASAWHVLNVTVLDHEGTSYTYLFWFLTELEITLSSPLNNTRQKSGTPVTLSFSEIPSIALYSWDSGTKSSSTGNIKIPAGDGEHWLKIEAENADIIHGTEWFTKYFVFTTDDTPPGVDYLSHVNGTRLNSGTEINLTVNEMATVLYSWDGVTSGTNLSPVPAGEGWHDLTVTMTDDLGNSGTEAFWYLVDDLPVELFLNSPVNGSTVEAGMDMNITFSEPPVTVYYSWNNGTNRTTPGNLPWGNGTQELAVHVSDGLNWNYQRFVFITVDPLVTITLVSPENGSRLTGEMLENELTIMFSETGTVHYQWDGGDNGTAAPDIPGGDGLHVLVVFALDSSGTWAVKRFIFTIDTTGPQVTATGPEIVFNTEPVDRNVYTVITFTFDEMLVNASYQWNLPDIEGAKTRFTGIDATYLDVPLPITSGTYTLVVEASDDLGNTATFSFTVEVISNPTGMEMLFMLAGIAAVVFGVPLTAGTLIYLYRERKRLLERFRGSGE